MLNFADIPVTLYITDYPEELINSSKPNSLLNFTFKFLVGYVAAATLFWVICRKLLVKDTIYPLDNKQHSWKNIRLLNRACYCSVCKMLLSSVTGLFCESCGICSHYGCIKKANTKFKCKEKFILNNRDKTINHIWIKGNLPLNSECNLCHENIDYKALPGLFGYRCYWCQRTYHTLCFKKLKALKSSLNIADVNDKEQNKMLNDNGILSNVDENTETTSDDDNQDEFIDFNEKCDFGPYKELIIPPTSVIPSNKFGLRKLHLSDIVPPDWNKWKPLIVIANTKSGSKTASDVVSLLKGLLNPIQVIELGTNGPQEPLQLALKIMPNLTKILVAGGDGTVGWVLNTIFSLGIRPIPEVAIMPLGTGNDLSRVTGWKSKPPSIIDPFKILDDIKKAKCILLDRWLMEIKTPRYRLPIQRAPQKQVYIYNYFSAGVDALVTLNFHRTRESPFYLLSNRILNKFIYCFFGMQQVLDRDCENIEKYLELYLDDKLINLPELQSIVFLNIDSWGAGVKLCTLSETEHSMSDGIMEVFGIVSSFHIAQLQVGISKPIRLGRAKHIKIKINHPCPVQADGEPWIQTPSEIVLQARGQAKLLLNK